MGIRNGLSMSRTGSGIYASIASMSSKTHFAASLCHILCLKRLQCRAFDDRNIVSGKSVLGQKLPKLELNEFDKLGIVHHVNLVQEYNNKGNTDLAGKKNVLAGLRHRAVVGGNHQDRPVHLSGPRDHVLYIVRMAGTIHMRIVALVGLIFDVGGCDRDAALALLGRLVDLVKRNELGLALLCKLLCNRCGKGRFPMVYVTNRPDIYMWLCPLEFLFSH